jgi:hypothetical protein
VSRVRSGCWNCGLELVLTGRLMVDTGLVRPLDDLVTRIRGLYRLRGPPRPDVGPGTPRVVLEAPCPANDGR